MLCSGSSDGRLTTCVVLAVDNPCRTNALLLPVNYYARNDPLVKLDRRAAELMKLTSNTKFEEVCSAGVYICPCQHVCCC